MNNVKPVICIDTGKVYDSVNDAAKDNFISHSAIVAACNGRRKTAAGKRWKYCNDYRAIIRAEIRAVLQADPVFMDMLEDLKQGVYSE